jgi:predicted ATPase
LLAGRFDAARFHLEQVAALYDPVAHAALIQQTGSHSRAVSRGYLGIALFCLGFPDQALAQSNAAIAEARTLAHPPSLAASLAQGARLLSLAGDDAGLDGLANELLALASDHGFPLYRAVGTIYLGWTKFKTGSPAEGLSLLRSGSSAYRTMGAESRTAYYIALLASACGLAGQVDEASSILDDAIEIVERIGERWFEAELYRHKGELMLQQRQSDVAERLYRKALAIAEKQDAKLWQLRAAMSLARLARDQGRRAEARDLLAPVYGWFTESFDGGDLTRAKALLDELS